MGSSPSVSPATFQEELDYQKGRAAPGGEAQGGNYGVNLNEEEGYGKSVLREAARRRRLLEQGLLGQGGKPEEVAPDMADAILRDVQTGKLRRARGGSSASALGTYSPASILGGVR